MISNEFYLFKKGMDWGYGSGVRIACVSGVCCHSNKYILSNGSVIEIGDTLCQRKKNNVF